MQNNIRLNYLYPDILPADLSWLKLVITLT